MAVSFIPFVFPGVPGVRCAFQTRTLAEIRPDDPWSGGNISFSVEDNPDQVRVNRAELAKSLGLEEDPSVGTGLAESNQVHGDVLRFDPAPVCGGPHALPPADGMATDRPGLGLLIKTADCQPLLLAHREGRHIAALHVGWRGNRIGFIGKAVAAFCACYGLKPQDLLAVRGPSLSPDAAEFIHFATEWGDEFKPWFRPASQTMNLWELTRHQLTRAGLCPDQIYGLDLCTASLESFFSYRRLPRSGRQASVIWIG